MTFPFLTISSYPSGDSLQELKVVSKAIIPLTGFQQQFGLTLLESIFKLIRPYWVSIPSGIASWPCPILHVLMRLEIAPRPTGSTRIVANGL